MRSKAHVTFALVVSAVLFLTTGFVYLLKVTYLPNLYSPQAEIQSSLHTLRRFDYLCARFTTSASKIQLLGTERRSLCNELLEDLTQNSDAHQAQASQIQEDYFNIKQLFGRLLLLHSIDQQQNPNALLLTNQLHTELENVSYDISSTLHENWTDVSEPALQRAYQNWLWLFLALLTASSMSVLTLISYYAEWSFNRKIVLLKACIIVASICYGGFLVIKATYVDYFQPTDFVQANSQVLSFESATGSKKLDTSIESTIGSKQKGVKEWIIQNNSPHKIVLSLAVAQIHNLENGCVANEAPVDATCESDQGELGELVNGQLSLKFDEIVLPFSSFVFTQAAVEQIETDWREFNTLSDTFSLDEQSLAVLDPGERLVLQLNWALLKEYGNEVQSDRLEFSLGVTARPYVAIRQ